jgi:hypothetical protein
MQMTEFPISHDPDRGVLKLAGSGGASIMLAFLLKAKFGEAFDPEMLFHAPLAGIMNSLFEHSQIPTRQSEGPFTRVQLQRLAKEIVTESWRSGWWAKSRDQRVAFLQQVVAAPYRLSDRQVDDILDDVEAELFWRRKVVAAADAAGEPST